MEVAGKNSREPRDKLMSDLKLVIADAEDLLKQTGHQAGEGFKVARDKFETTLESVKNELGHWEDQLVTRTKDAAHATDQYVKENPWQAVGVGAAVGLLIGLLVSRK